MFLVAVLAVAGIAGILAAVYLTLRSGKRGGNRLRPAGAGRIGADRAGAAKRPAGRIGRPAKTGGQTEFALRASGPARPARPAAGNRPARAQASTLTESWPAAPSDLDDPQPADAWAADAWPGDSPGTDPGLRATEDAKPRRRVGFRKGAEIDEELWPADSFGGVSDEQFWDDLASDKPLTTTARTAQQEAGPRSRLPGTGTDTDSPGSQAPGRNGPGQGRPAPGRGAPAQGPGRSAREAGEGRRSAGYGAYPGPRTGAAASAGVSGLSGADPTDERTMVQPTYAATQPVKSMTPPRAPAAPPPARGSAPPAKSATPPPGAPPPARTPAAEPAGRRRASGPEDDPLTSASFSLRSRGPVDGRSSLRPRDQQDAPRERDAGSAGRGPAGPYGHTAPYPAAGTSYDDASSATQMMVTPPYGENYGGGGNQADHPRQRAGARSHARPGGTGEQPRPPRPAYPQDVHQASGSYPAGAYPGNGRHGHGYQPGGYPGNGTPGSPAVNGTTPSGNGTPGGGQPEGGRPGNQNGANQNGGYPGGGARGNGHRTPRDPRDDYRRLTHRSLPSRLGSCPKEMWSGRPPAACTRRWRDGR